MTFFDKIRAKLDDKPLSIIVFGASGHLAKTKTYPSLFDCFIDGCLPNNFNCIGYGRSKLNKSDFHSRISLKLKGSKVSNFLDYCTYINGKSYGDPESLIKLFKYIRNKEGNGKNANRLFYLAVPPNVFSDICAGIKKYMSNEDNNGWTRVIIEKPFGNDLESCNKMNIDINKYLTEKEIYRVDHYLAKELIQNIIGLRFSNIMFSSIWNNKYIKCIKISMKETDDVDGRGGYYEENGVIRDVLQNHLLQVLSLIAMEYPVSLNADDIRDEKAKVLKYIKPITTDNTIVGQYISDGIKPGYTQDKTVNDSSTQITYVKTVLSINNPRWSNVPFICECGKALNTKSVDIRIQFKSETNLFNNTLNELHIRVQPNAEISLLINNKIPGYNRFNNINPYCIKLNYSSEFNNIKLPNAYTTLIMDSLNGDQSLFVRNDELYQAWRIVTPYLNYIESPTYKPATYVRGTTGPNGINQMDINSGFNPNNSLISKL